MNRSWKTYKSLLAPISSTFDGTHISQSQFGQRFGRSVVVSAVSQWSEQIISQHPWAQFGKLTLQNSTPQLGILLPQTGTPPAKELLAERVTLGVAAHK